MIQDVMTAVQLTGHGGFDKLSVCEDVPIPKPASDQVLIKVGAAGVNNTDVNTRIGWYSKSVTGDTNAAGESGYAGVDTSDGDWSGAGLQFPRIQGADCCGEIIAVGADVAKSRIGERVLVRAMQENPAPVHDLDCWTFGSECDGGFAQYAVARSNESFPVNSDWSDVELASIPCAYSTAEGMLARGSVGAETVLITGASGGVGSAAIQLAKRRGAKIIAVCGKDKADTVKSIGADEIVGRDDILTDFVNPDSVDVVLDLVAGPTWPTLLDVLKRGGRYITSGAIAGPIVELDVRTLYLKDLSLFGSTYQPKSVFTNLISYIERNEIKPLVAKTYPLADIVSAQKDFLSKKHTGKLVLIPPQI